MRPLDLTGVRRQQRGAGDAPGALKGRDEHDLEDNSRDCGAVDGGEWLRLLERQFRQQVAGRHGRRYEDHRDQDHRHEDHRNHEPRRTQPRHEEQRGEEQRREDRRLGNRIETCRDRGEDHQVGKREVDPTRPGVGGDRDQGDSVRSRRRRQLEPVACRQGAAGLHAGEEYDRPQDEAGGGHRPVRRARHAARSDRDHLRRINRSGRDG